jgi:hypothetical protein
LSAALRGEAADAAPNSVSDPLPLKWRAHRDRVGKGPMSVRETVRDAQRRLAAVDADYARAIAKFNRASARRTEILADRDRLIAVAQDDVEKPLPSWPTP